MHSIYLSWDKCLYLKLIVLTKDTQVMHFHGCQHLHSRTSIIVSTTPNSKQGPLTPVYNYTRAFIANLIVYLLQSFVNEREPNWNSNKSQTGMNIPNQQDEHCCPRLCSTLHLPLVRGIEWAFAFTSLFLYYEFPDHCGFDFLAHIRQDFLANEDRFLDFKALLSIVF